MADADPPALGSPVRPLRVVVVASSVGMFVRPPRADPSEGTYADVLECRLRAAGLHTEVVNRSRWLLTAREAYHDLQPLLLDHRADVVVLDFGFVDSQPRLTPLWLVRHLFTWHPTLEPGRRRARRALLGPLFRLYVRGMGPATRRMPWLASRARPDVFAATVASIAAIARKERAAHVIALNVPPTTAQVERTFATMNRRIAATNAALAAMAAAPGAPVLLDVAAVVDAHGHDSVLPDGIHFNARGHELVADLLAAEITRWAADQTTRPAPRPTR